MSDAALEAVLHYAGRGWVVFPCRPGRKTPLTEHGFYDATIDPAQIEAWWRRWPEALIGVPTGKLSRLVILDVDVKDPRKNGFDSLADLGRSILPDTPMAHSGSGGLHIYFACIDQEIRNSESELGPGLDVRGEGGYIIVPAPGSGYTWDPHCNFNTVALLPAPAWLGHRRRRERPRKSGYSHLDPQALLAISCRLIRAAGNGERHKVLNREGFIVGTLVGAHALNQNEAYHQLEAAAAVMVSRTGGDFDKAERDLAGAFVDGLGQPRRVRR